MSIEPEKNIKKEFYVCHAKKVLADGTVKVYEQYVPRRTKKIKKKPTGRPRSDIRILLELCDNATPEQLLKIIEFVKKYIGDPNEVNDLCSSDEEN